MKNCPSRADLLQQINKVSFAVDDVKLYLDTHPCDEEAIAYFQKYSHISKGSTVMKKCCGV